MVDVPAASPALKNRTGDDGSAGVSRVPSTEASNDVVAVTSGNCQPFEPVCPTPNESWTRWQTPTIGGCPSGSSSIAGPIGCTGANDGAVERVPVVRVGNLRRFVDRLKDQGFRVIGLDPSGESIYGLD